MNIIRTNSSRQAPRGRMSGGGRAWQPPHAARAFDSSSPLCGATPFAVNIVKGNADGPNAALIHAAKKTRKSHAATRALTRRTGRLAEHMGSMLAHAFRPTCPVVVERA